MKLRSTFMNQTNRKEEEALKKCEQILRGPRRELLLVLLEVLYKEQKVQLHTNIGLKPKSEG